MSTNAIEVVVEGRTKPVGTITVARVLPTLARRAVGPFVFLDHMGPIAIPPGAGFDVAPHPHIGLSTVTYLYAGEIVHRDSVGSLQSIQPGAVNLMTAGRGVAHSERSSDAWRASGGTLHGVQIWLALPKEREDDAPTFEHHASAVLPNRTLARGVEARVVLGSAFGARSPVVHASRPMCVALELEAGVGLDVPDAAPERALFVVDGAVTCDGRTLAPNSMAVLAPASSPRLVATERSRVLVFGGPPLDGPRFMDWNFVSSSKERIERAKADWRARRFPLVPGDEHEFIPLPEPGAR